MMMMMMMMINVTIMFELILLFDDDDDDDYYYYDYDWRTDDSLPVPASFSGFPPVHSGLSKWPRWAAWVSEGLAGPVVILTSGDWYRMKRPKRPQKYRHKKRHPAPNWEASTFFFVYDNIYIYICICSTVCVCIISLFDAIFVAYFDHLDDLWCWIFVTFPLQHLKGNQPEIIRK